jgi:hypothetical protein
MSLVSLSCTYRYSHFKWLEVPAAAGRDHSMICTTAVCGAMSRHCLYVQYGMCGSSTPHSAGGIIVVVVRQLAGATSAVWLTSWTLLCRLCLELLRLLLHTMHLWCYHDRTGMWDEVRGVTFSLVLGWPCSAKHAAGGPQLCVQPLPAPAGRVHVA